MESPNYHRKQLFDKLTSMGVASNLAQLILAFWLWLESKGLENVVVKFASLDSDLFDDVALEAERILSSLQANASSSSVHLTATLFISCNKSFFLKDVLEQGRASAIVDINQLMTGICNEICGGRIEENSEFLKDWKLEEEYRCLHMTFLHGPVPFQAQIGVYFSEYVYPFHLSINLH